MISILRLTLALIVAGFALSSDAAAQAGHHTRPVVTPRVRGGRVVGARIRTTLRSGAYHLEAMLVLLKTDNLPPSDGAAHRQIVANIGPHADSPFVRYRHPAPIQVGDADRHWDTRSQDVTIDVDYGDGPNQLRPGERVELVTGWPDRTLAHWIHIHGYFPHNNDPTNMFTLPAGNNRTTAASSAAKSRVQANAASTPQAATRQATSRSRRATRPSGAAAPTASPASRRRRPARAAD